MTGPDAPANLPPGWIIQTVPGFLSEPALLKKFIATSERRASDEREPADGLYVETGNMITGEGWISAGPGYRRHVLGGRMLVDASDAVSWKLYNVAQASVELPHLAHDRLTVGAQAMHQDYLQVDYFGLGNDSRASDQSAYRFKNTDVLGYATIRATDWLSVSGRFGEILRPSLSAIQPAEDSISSSRPPIRIVIRVPTASAATKSTPRSSCPSSRSDGFWRCTGARCSPTSRAAISCPFT